MGRTWEDIIAERASPDEWADFAVSKMFVHTMLNCKPERIHQNILSQSYSENRKPGLMFVFDASQKKIGRQAIQNRLSTLSKKIKMSWTFGATKDQVRIGLKRSFFKYVK